MGVFSWITQDTNKSISNAFSSRGTFKVIMTDDKGNQYIEKNYEGYGSFGGMDYHVLVDKMNNGKGDRDRGIEIAYRKDWNKFKFPSLSESGAYFPNSRPENCKDQGMFYEGWLDK